MTKTIINLLMLLFILAGCSKANEDEREDKKDDFVLTDFNNYSIPILVTDALGNNLLDPKTPHNLLKEEIKVIYKGEEFKRMNVNQPGTRFNMPAPLALRTRLYTVSGYSGDLFMMAFGEFGSGNYQDESFTIHWADGTEDIIKFDMYTTSENKKAPTVHITFYLNGEKWTSSKPITIIRPKVG